MVSVVSLLGIFSVLSTPFSWLLVSYIRYCQTAILFSLFFSFSSYSFFLGSWVTVAWDRVRGELHTTLILEIWHTTWAHMSWAEKIKGPCLTLGWMCSWVGGTPNKDSIRCLLWNSYTCQSPFPLSRRFTDVYFTVVRNVTTNQASLFALAARKFKVKFAVHL